MSFRTLSSVLLVATLAALAGCADDSSSSKSGSGSDSTEDTASDVGGEESGDPIDWTGTWTIDVDYTLECSYFSQTEQESLSGTWVLPLTGDNEDLEASLESGWYVLDGAGDDDRIRLTGSFHFEAIWNDAMSGSDNNVSFDGNDVVSGDQVFGEVSGYFTGGSGEDCDILEGTFEMTR